MIAVAPIANLTDVPEGAKAGEAIRDAIYSELSRRQEDYTVVIQDIAETDKRIHESAMTDSAASRLPGPDLCKMLGVEAVMKGNVTRYKKHGAVGQVATMLLFGGATGSEVEAAVSIYDGGDGRMIWQHNIEKAGGFLSSPDGLRKQGRRRGREKVSVQEAGGVARRLQPFAHHGSPHRRPGSMFTFYRVCA